MQVLQAGQHKLLLLELDPDFIANIAKQTGFEHKLDDGPRTLTLDLAAPDRQGPLLLFDAADPGNLGWFSRCQFYVDGNTGAVLQTPIAVANLKDRSGRAIPNSIRLQITKELPATFRLPGKQPVTATDDLRGSIQSSERLHEHWSRRMRRVDCEAPGRPQRNLRRPQLATLPHRRASVSN
jgi:hypothetical protein